jgi:hypothetical protein
VNPNHFPDGLTESVIDALIAESYAAVQPVRRPTSPFALPEDTRRERRETSRTLAKVARLPLPLAPVPNERAA